MTIDTWQEPEASALSARDLPRRLAMEREQLEELVSQRRIHVSRLNQQIVSRSLPHGRTGHAAGAAADMQQQVAAMAVEITARKQQIRDLERAMRRTITSRDHQPTPGGRSA